MEDQPVARPLLPTHKTTHTQTVVSQYNILKRHLKGYSLYSSLELSISLIFSAQNDKSISNRMNRIRVLEHIILETTSTEAASVLLQNRYVHLEVS
jgi:hypothetical protein